MKQTIRKTRFRGGGQHDGEPIESSEVVFDEPGIDPAALASMLERFRSEQSLGQAAVFGLLAAGVGAALWAGITLMLGYQIGFMAIGVGLLVGYAVRVGGKGIDRIFGVLGAAFSLVGCIAGNAITVNYFISEVMNAEGIPGDISVGMLLSAMVESFGFMDIIFYGIALYEGYHFSFRKVTDEDLSSLRGGD